MITKEQWDLLRKFDEYFDNLRDTLVPDMGKADTVAGEIIRAMDRLVYRFLNDGDCVGIDYGNETCNGSYRYLCHMLQDKMPNLTYVSDDGKYMELLLEMMCVIMNYFHASPVIMTLRNTVDSRSDFDDPEDRNWDKEYDDYDGEDW